MHGELCKKKGGALRTTRDSRKVFWGRVDTDVVSWMRKSELDEKSVPERKHYRESHRGVKKSGA